MIGCGDDGLDHTTRGYLRFDISMIPTNATFTEATIRIGQEVLGGSPYADLGGRIVVDHIELGGSLDPSDFTATSVYSANVATLSTTPTLELKSAEVVSSVQADVSNVRGHADFQLRFPVVSDADGVADYVLLNNVADDAGTGRVPRLEIRFRP